MSAGTAVALVLALASTALVNIAYLREHDAAVSLPTLSVRRPLRSVRLLLENRSWLVGFALETTGFLLYAGALALASLALVQAIGAGGIGVLAYLSARLGGRQLGRRQVSGVLLSVLGLLALAVSLAGGSGKGGNGSTAAILLWMGATLAVALLVLALARKLGLAVTAALAGGLFFSIGDISTKIATQGGVRILFVVTLIVGYTAGTILLQVGYQKGAALTVAGIATLLTNALPIAAGTVVLDEPVPPGAYGAVRVLAFAAVTASAFLLARPDRSRTETGGKSSGL
jgi:drug/metabolite transporter (DMT)-like permease